MSDDAFIRAILADPADDAARLIYADWLEERGNPRGEYLRLEVALAALGRAEPVRGQLQDRLREAAAGIDLSWLAAVSRVPIENCGVSFQFRCPKRWEQLQPTSDEAVRFCGNAGSGFTFAPPSKSPRPTRPWASASRSILGSPADPGIWRPTSGSWNPRWASPCLKS